MSKNEQDNNYLFNAEEADRYEVFCKHLERVRYHYAGVDNNGLEIPPIDMSKLDHIFSKEIEILSKSERKIVASKRSAFFILRAYVTSAKKKAFGGKKSKEIEELFLKDKEDELLELFFKFFTIDEVYKTVNVEWGIPTTMKSLALFRERNADRIREGQLEYKESIDDLRLVHKRSRLEEFAWLYSIVKDKIDKSQSMESIREASNLLEKVKKEVEGDKVVIEGNLQMDIRQTIDIHTQKQVLDKLSLMQIIIGRISAKQGINPEFMINRLIKSSYAKFSGFAGASEEEMKTAEIFLPSQMANYNFESIIANRPNLIEEEKKAKIIDITNIQNPEEVKVKKNKLLEIIKNKQKEVGNKEIAIDVKKSNPKD